MTRHLLEIDDLSATELRAILDLAVDPSPPRVLEGRGMALVFEKPSARTRNSMEMAVVQLGGHPVTIRGDEVGFDVRETVEDVTRTLGCYHAAIGARVFDHRILHRMAAVSPAPIVNMLCDTAHPLQALADLLTIQSAFGTTDGVTVAWVGDANNVCRSLALACGRLGMPLRIAAPAGYQFGEADLDRLRASGADPLVTTDPAEAVAGADVVATDVWTSMGQEDERASRLDAFAGFGVDGPLMAATSDRSIFLHCLPAHRGEEVAAEVIDGARSRVWPQAENRMHAARGLLVWLLTEGEA